VGGKKQIKKKKTRKKKKKKGGGKQDEKKKKAPGGGCLSPAGKTRQTPGPVFQNLKKKTLPEEKKIFGLVQTPGIFIFGFIYVPEFRPKKKKILRWGEGPRADGAIALKGGALKATFFFFIHFY